MDIDRFTFIPADSRSRVMEADPVHLSARAAQKVLGLHFFLFLPEPLSRLESLNPPIEAKPEYKTTHDGEQKLDACT